MPKPNKSTTIKAEPENWDDVSAVFQITHDAIITIDQKEKIMLFNQGAERIFGYLASEVIRKPLGLLLPESLREIHHSHVRNFIAAPEVTRQMGSRLEISGRRKDGSLFPAQAGIAKVRHGKQTWFTVILCDLSARKQAEAALLATQEKYRILVENASEVFYQVALETEPLRGKVTFISPQAEGVTGYRSEMGSQDADFWLKLIHPDDLSIATETTKEILSSRVPGTRQYRIRHIETGAYRWIEDRVVPQVDSLGKLVSYQGVARDITEHKYHEQELEAVVSLSSVLRKALSLNEMPPIILSQLLALLKVESIALAMHDSITDEIVIELAQGEFALHTGPRQALDPSVTERVIATSTLYLCNDVRSDPSFSTYDLLTHVRAVACTPLIARDRTIGALWVGQASPFSEHDLNLIGATANIIANALHRAILHEQTVKGAAELAQAYESTLEGWSRALDLRDKETEGHTQRVTEMTIRLARAMGLSEEEIVHVRRGALLHDIGKMGIPDAILFKPNVLTADEWAIMRQHPSFAYELLSPIMYLSQSLDIPYCHHEKWDGTGYPRGLHGEAIPLAARIFAVVDVWDALRSDRAYRKAWRDDEVMEYIRAIAGTHLDPKVVEVFETMIDV